MINNRRQMTSYFEDILYKNHERFKNEQKNATNQLKSYIVEGHMHSQGLFHDEVIELLTNIDINKDKYQFSVHETEDEHLIKIIFDSGEIFVDLINPRFWTLHSAIKADKTDYVKDKILKNRQMDHIWLPIPFLKKLTKLGELYGFGISFTEYLEKNEHEQLLFENQNTLKIESKRLYVNELLKLIDHSDFKNIAGINKVSILNYTKSEEDDHFIVDDITYNGKITGKGTSFQKHQLTVQNIKNYYEAIINNIEQKYSFKYNSELGAIEGMPIEISLKRRQVDIHKLVDLLFSGKKPFMLWGIADWRSENKCYVDAIDLHVGNFGQKISFEIKPGLIRIILPQKSCGNTIARLITNIHQSIDATSIVKGGDNYELFNF